MKAKRAGLVRLLSSLSAYWPKCLSQGCIHRAATPALKFHLAELKYCPEKKGQHKGSSNKGVETKKYERKELKRTDKIWMTES
jgi:hypothetical protein